MTDYYHFFGLKDKENRFLMRLVNPFAFDITTAVVKLSQLFATHGSCPTTNDVTWSPWKAGKTLYQFWNVTPNKAGIIKSATPTLTLDGVDYLGTPIYLLSLPNYIKVYTNSLTLHDEDYYHRIYFYDLDNTLIDGYVNEFIPVNLGEFDPTNMSGIYLHLKDTAVTWATIKPWVEAGNIWVEAYYSYLVAGGIMTVSSNRTLDIGESMSCIQSDPELYPAANKTGVARATIPKIGSVDSMSPPSGWTSRPLFQFTHAGTTYDMIVEFVHTASGGRVIYTGGFSTGVGPGYMYCPVMPAWWYPIILFQYPMMKYAGVSASYLE